MRQWTNGLWMLTPHEKGLSITMFSSPAKQTPPPQSFPPENAHARASDVRFRETKDDIDGRIPITLHL